MTNVLINRNSKRPARGKWDQARTVFNSVFFFFIFFPFAILFLFFSQVLLNVNIEVYGNGGSSFTDDEAMAVLTSRSSD